MEKAGLPPINMYFRKCCSLIWCLIASYLDMFKYTPPIGLVGRGGGGSQTTYMKYSFKEDQAVELRGSSLFPVPTPQLYS